jgi:hypothetical protein
VTLVLKRRTDVGDPNAFKVASGDAWVGIITRIPNGPKQGQWLWSITGWIVEPVALGPTTGIEETLEKAMAAFARRWRVWLSWSDLKERGEI